MATTEAIINTTAGELNTINVADMFMQLMIIGCVLCLLLVLVWFLTGFPCNPFEMIRRSE